MNKKMVRLGEKTNLTKGEVAKLTKIGISGVFALILSVVSAGWGAANAAEAKHPSDNYKARPLPERCGLKPEHGPCKAMFERYYFDAATKECKPFYYGGCGGVMPFETQEECVNACIDQKTGREEIPPTIGHKYGGVGIRDFENVE